MTNRSRFILILLISTLGLLVIFLASRVIFTRLSQQEQGIELGLVRHAEPRPIAPFTFQDEKGALHTLEEWHGEVVILNLWGTWCPPCRREMPALNRLQADLEGESIQVITLNLDHPGQVPPAIWLDREGLNNLSAYHGNDAAILAATGTRIVPTTLIIGRNGMERARINAEANWDSQRFRMMIAYYAQ